MEKGQKVQEVSKEIPIKVIVTRHHFYKRPNASNTQGMRKGGCGGNSMKKGFENTPSPKFPCELNMVRAILKKWVEDKVVELPKSDNPLDMTKEKYCPYHQHNLLALEDCLFLRRLFPKEDCK